MSHAKRVKSSHTESCPYGRLSVLWIFLLLDECVEGGVYEFRVKDIEITEVAKMAKMTEGVQGIRATARHVVWPVAEMAKVSKMAKASIKTARHVMWSLGKVAV
jgi:hypothetical protein